jgi:hypothetical protein
MTEVCDAGGAQVKPERDEVSLHKRGILDATVETFWRIMRQRQQGIVNISSHERKRIVAAWVCLFTAVALYAPLAGGAWSAHAMACCTQDHCPIAQHHHHHQEKQAPSPAEMDCGHGMGAGEIMNCSMSCCENSDKPLVTAVAFVLPHLALSANCISIAGVAEPAQAIEIPRSLRPLSPPPRFAHL